MTTVKVNLYSVLSSSSSHL